MTNVRGVRSAIPELEGCRISVNGNSGGYGAEGAEILAGNTLRALVKHLDRMPADEIADLNIPTGIPLIYEVDGRLESRNANIRSFVIETNRKSSTYSCCYRKILEQHGIGCKLKIYEKDDLDEAIHRHTRPQERSSE